MIVVAMFCYFGVNLYILFVFSLMVWGTSEELILCIIIISTTGSKANVTGDERLQLHAAIACANTLSNYYVLLLMCNVCWWQFYIVFFLIYLLMMIKLIYFHQCTSHVADSKSFIELCSMTRLRTVMFPPITSVVLWA